MTLPKQLSHGFTLVELVIVLAVLGVLMTIAFASINPVAQVKKANDTKRKSDLEQIQRALQSYYSDTGQYPAQASGTNAISGATWGSQWIVNGATYMSKVPSDPTSTYQYVYVMNDATGQSYYLFAHLDNTNDPQICQNKINGVNECANAAGLKCKTATADTCNYGVSSPNTTP